MFCGKIKYYSINYIKEKITGVPMNSRKSFLFISVLFITFISVSFFSCKQEVEDTKEVVAQTPVITAISPDVSTIFNKAVTLSITAEVTDGGTLTYQWYSATEDKLKAGTAIEDGDGFSGTKSKDFMPAVSAAGTFYYYCVVTNKLEESLNSATSPRITVVVDSVINARKPVITAEPVNIKAIVPAEGTFTIGAASPDNGILSYQWYTILENEEEQSEGTAITDAVQNTYKVTADSVGKTGYYCVVTNTIEDNGDGGKKSESITSSVVYFEAVNLKDTLNSPVFTKQPVAMNIANPSALLSCEAVVPNDYSAFYRWYKTEDGTVESGEPVTSGWSSSSEFETPSFTEKGIYYYFCRAASYIPSEEDNLDEITSCSNVVSVAYTGLPTVYVNTPEGVAITSKEDWLKNSKISICGAENDSWNFTEIQTSIRGRGNSTWEQPKKPYALKLDKKQSILGMPAHKRWVLIANYLDNSFIRNEMAFYLSEVFELDYTVHGKFVDLIMNGEYKGLYWLGEAIKVDSNRVNINDGSKNMTDDEDKDYLIEMDVNYDEPVKFKSSIRNMPYMIKNDDYMVDDDGNITSGGQARLERLQTKIANLENLLYPDYTEGMNTDDCSAPDESYTQMLDVESWAKFWLINEIMSNGELGHPKSCYFTFDSTNNLIKAGPVWDFDWASLYIHNSCILKSKIYYNALFKSISFKNALIHIWNEYENDINLNSRLEFLKKEISIAAKYDAVIWGVNHNPAQIEFLDFNEHVDFLKTVLNTKHSVVKREVEMMKQ